MPYYNKQNAYSIFDNLKNPKDEVERNIPLYQNMLNNIYYNAGTRTQYGTNLDATQAQALPKKGAGSAGAQNQNGMLLELPRIGDVLAESRFGGTKAQSDLDGQEATTDQNSSAAINPFLDEDGNLFNDTIDYQNVLKRKDLNSRTRRFISEATGISSQEDSSSDDSTDSSDDSYSGNSWTVNSSDGVFKNNELMNIIKKVSGETGVPTNVLLAVAQQETGGKWFDKVADGTGYSYGYMMLYDNGVIADLKAKGKTNLAEKAKTDPYTNVLVGAQYLKLFYDQSGSWQKACSRYNGSGTAAQNYGSKVWSRANTDAYLNAYKNPSSSSSGKASKTGNKIVDNANKYMGVKYVWGGSTTSGMDCSGFVSAVLKDCGYNYGRQTAQGFRSYGKSVSKADMQPGDVIFYGKSGNASHCGIYIGNGKMIHSSGGSNNTASNPGKGVSIQNVNYRGDFIEARRY